MTVNGVSHAPTDDPFELIFLGTGTSSGLPNVSCLTAPPESKRCHTCLSTMRPEGKKNIRRNTSVAMRVRGKDGNKITVLIDVGKSFQAAAIDWFPKYGLRRIDAVLITHAHADAMNGLDDLRAWTLRGAIQPHVDLYCSQATFKEVQRAFPYLVSKEYASGGGDVPEFKWHIIEDRAPFEIKNTGVWIKPFSVHHGRVFSLAPPVGFEFMPSPMANSPASTESSTPNPPGSPVQNPTSLTFHPPPTLPISQPHPVVPTTDIIKPIQPYLSFGFVVQDQVIYISDVSLIPEDVWNFLLPVDTPKLPNGTGVTTNGHVPNGNGHGHGTSHATHRGPPVLILDCLCLHTHTSHLGIGDSITFARRFDPQRTYLTGFGHEISHDEYVTLGEAVSGLPLRKKEEELTENEKRGLAIVEERKGDGKPIWLRPAFDGLKLVIDEDGRVRDEGYD